MSLWSDNLLKYSHQISLDVHIVKEVEQGLKLGSQLKLPIEISFNYHRMASFAIGVMSMRQFAIIMYVSLHNLIFTCMVLFNWGKPTV